MLIPRCDRAQVLRFYAFFKEAVTDSALENQRVRKCAAQGALRVTR